MIASAVTLSSERLLRDDENKRLGVLFESNASRASALRLMALLVMAVILLNPCRGKRRGVEDEEQV
jgi:hypothetical protein